MSFRILLSSLLVSGCATHYQLDVIATEPERLPPGMFTLESSACPSAAWRTSYDWRAFPDAHRKRGRPVRISSRCADVPGQAQAGKVELAGDAKIELTGSVRGSGPAEPRMLEGFTFDAGDGIVDIRDTNGRPRTIAQVKRIEYYGNVVIIRAADGSGFIVDPPAVLGVRWNADAAKK